MQFAAVRAKVNKLMKDHLPHFKTINLSGVNLGNALIDFMPRAVAQEGRALVRELTTAGTLSDSTVVINRCTELVAENADVGVEHAVMAAALLPAGPQRAAAMAAAMLPVAVNVAAPAPAQSTGGKSDPFLQMLKAHAGESKQAAAALAAYTGGPPPKANPKDKSGRDKKKEARAAREAQHRLPDGKFCKANSCNFDHDTRYPGMPCYRDPKWGGRFPQRSTPTDARRRASSAIESRY